MIAMSEALSRLRIATLRFEYPYSSDPNFIPFTDMQVDGDEVLIETVKAAFEFGQKSCPELKVLIGGHSISGLVATYADAEVPLQAAGIVCLGFPRKGDPARSQHLVNTSVPLLFVQGTKDTFGRQSEIEQMVRPLGDRASLKWIEGATHVFSIEGQSLNQVAGEIAKAVRIFADHI